MQVLLNGLSVASLYALAAVGVTLIFGVSRLVHFAHGQMALIAAYVVVVLAGSQGRGLLLSSGIALLVVGLIAWLMFAVLMRHLVGVSHFNQIVGTLGLAFVIQGSILYYFGSDARGVPGAFGSVALEVGGARIALSRALGVGVAVVLLILLGLALTRTEFGRRVRAVAQDPETAELVGIHTMLVQRRVFVIASVMAAMAGVLLAVSVVVTPTSGLTITLVAYAVAILGGLGRPIGALVGAFLIGLGESVVGVYVPGGSGWVPAVAFLIIIGAAIIRPEGLQLADR